MGAPRSPSPPGWPPSSRAGRFKALVAYLVFVCAFVGVVYWISPADVWSAIGPALGSLIGLVVLSTPPARRWLIRLRRSRWGDGPPDERWR